MSSGCLLASPETGDGARSDCAPFHFLFGLYNDTPDAWRFTVSPFLSNVSVQGGRSQTEHLAPVSNETGRVHLRVEALDGSRSFELEERWHGYRERPERHEVRMTSDGILYVHGAVPYEGPLC